jgi:predicted ester cyclase
MRWTVEEQIGDEDTVWSRSTWQGTHQGPVLGVPATGKKVTVAAWTINRFAGGKIAQGRIIADTLGMMQQLGVIAAPA